MRKFICFLFVFGFYNYQSCDAAASDPHLAGGSYYDDLDSRLTSARQLSTWVSNHPDSSTPKDYIAYIVTEYSTMHDLTKAQAVQLVKDKGTFRCEPVLKKR